VTWKVDFGLLSADSGYYEGESGSRPRPKRSETPDTPGDHEGRPISRINMPVGLEGLESPGGGVLVEQLSRETFDSSDVDGTSDSGCYAGQSSSRPRRKRFETPDTPGDHEGHPISGINMPVGLEGGVLENPREEFLEKVFGENEAFTSRSPTTPTNSGGSSNRSQSNTTPPSFLTSTTDGSQEPRKSYKRKRGSDEEEEGSPPDRPRKQGKTRPSDIYGQERSRGRRFACHFHLLQKEMYCKNNRTGKRYETCSGPGWPTIHHLK